MTAAPVNTVLTFILRSSSTFSSKEEIQFSEDNSTNTPYSHNRHHEEEVTASFLSYPSHIGASLPYERRHAHLDLIQNATACRCPGSLGGGLGKKDFVVERSGCTRER